MKHPTLKQIITPAKKSLSKRIVKSVINDNNASEEKVKSAETSFEVCCGKELEKDLIRIIIKYGVEYEEVYKEREAWREKYTK